MPEQHQWWAYLHVNGSIQLKRWWGDQATLDDAYESPFVDEVLEPFDADNREQAEKIAKSKLGNRADTLNGYM